MSKSIDKMIVADIFGVTPALIALGRTINADIIVDPYGGKVMNFDNEAQAYHYFINNVGLDAYVNKLSKIMKECADKLSLSALVLALLQSGNYLHQPISK